MFFFFFRFFGICVCVCMLFVVVTSVFSLFWNLSQSRTSSGYSFGLHWRSLSEYYIIVSLENVVGDGNPNVRCMN